MIGIFIIAHAPLASAMRQCVAHVFAADAQALAALDVQPHMPPEETLAQARILIQSLGRRQVLVLTDVFGATPCNVAQQLVDGVDTRLVAGLNLPMLLRAVSYRHETLEALVARVIAGGSQGVMQVAVTAPQNQNRKLHDQDHRDHQQ
jgi:PTS system mannose-specific IIA component